MTSTTSLETTLSKSSLRAEQLIYVCGLKRSGLHALSFWLLGHCTSNAFVNNSPAKRPGKSSVMSRTISTSPLPVVLHQGDKIAYCFEGEEKFRPLPEAVDLLVVLFQSQHLWHLSAQDPLVLGVEATNTKRVLLLRDPFNWAASYMKKSQHPDDTSVWPHLWKEYAKEYIGATNYLPDAIKVNYNNWFVDQSYRRQLSVQLGLNFTDKALEVVTSHGKGSSFELTKFDRRAQQMQVLERWQFFKDNAEYLEAFRRHQDIVEMAEEIFDLPPELAEFAAECKM